MLAGFLSFCIMGVLCIASWKRESFVIKYLLIVYVYIYAQWIRCVFYWRIFLMPSISLPFAWKFFLFIPVFELPITSPSIVPVANNFSAHALFSWHCLLIPVNYSLFHWFIQELEAEARFWGSFGYYALFTMVCIWTIFSFHTLILIMPNINKSIKNRISEG